MTRSTLLRCFILGLPVARLGAQPARPIVRVDPLNLEAERLKTSADLALKDVGLSGLGQVVFILQNRGDVSINGGGRLTPAASSITTPPIRIDIHIGGAMVQSVYQASLAGQTGHAFAVMPLSNVPKCKDVRDIRIVVDPQNVVPELHDDNNTAAVSIARPCPDLAVKSIEREKSGIAGRPTGSR